METVDSEGVNTSFFKTGQSKVELLQATKNESTIAKFIAKKGEGIHHIAFAVNDIHKEIKRLKEGGYTIINENPKKGADNKLVCFLHPKNTKGVLIEFAVIIPSLSMLILLSLLVIRVTPSIPLSLTNRLDPAPIVNTLQSFGLTFKNFSRDFSSSGI